MGACLRNDDGQSSEWFEVAQGLRQECVLSLLLFNVFFAAILLVTLERFGEDADILAHLAHLQEQPSKVGPETALEYVQRVTWEMLYADDACIVSRSPRGLERMMTVFVEVSGAFGLTISESKTETMYMPIPRALATQIVFNATGQQLFVFVCYLTPTDPLRIQSCSQDRRNQTKSKPETWSEKKSRESRPKEADKKVASKGHRRQKGT